MVLERVRAEHAEELFEVLGDPRVARTLYASGVPQTDAEMADNLVNKLEHWERYGFGLWLLRDRQTGTVVGRGGLQHTFVAGCDEVEVAWAIAPARWREGLATEMAHAAVHVAFDDLGLGEIVAFTLPTNIAITAGDGEERLRLRARDRPCRTAPRALPTGPPHIRRTRC